MSIAFVADIISQRSSLVTVSLLGFTSMGRKIRIKTSLVEVVAELNDTKTAQAIWEALPIKRHGNLWDEEIFFSIPLSLEPEAGQELVSIGNLGYWPQGSAFCVFFGPTLISQ